MFSTLNMGLVAWDLPDDSYDHGQLANNFVVLDRHNHAGGKGVQIPSEGLQDRSVTTTKIAPQAVTGQELADNTVGNAKLQDNSVGASKIIDGSVGTAELTDGAVTAAKIDPNYLPVGAVLMWGRPDALPVGGWEVMDGRPWSSITNTMGYTTGNIPDMRNAFPLGAVFSGSGSSPGDSPAIGQAGGAQTIDLRHTHTGGAHAHSTPDHTHSISAVGDHFHRFPDDDDNPNDLYTRLVGVVTSVGQREALYVPGRHSDGTGAGSSNPARMISAGGHNHGGSTGGVTGLNTGSAGAVATSPASIDLSAVDKRPRFAGLMFIMRVR